VLRDLATAFGEHVLAGKYNGGRIRYARGSLSVTASTRRIPD